MAQATHGEMEVLVRSHPWAQTPLGPIDQWPQSLSTAVSLMLNAGGPMAIFWGPQRVMLYNDSCRALLADQHPRALGQPGPEVWPELWPEPEAVGDRGLAQGQILGPLPRPRQGQTEDVYFTAACSPVQQEDGGVGGLLCLYTETARPEVCPPVTRSTQILEAMSDGFVAFDHDWRITYQNAASERINGKPRAEVLGKTCWEEWPELVGSELEAYYRRTVADQVAVQFEHHYIEPPDHDLWLEVHAYPSPAGLNVFYRDITHRKRTEADLKAQRLQVQQQLAEIETIYQSAPIGLGVLDDELRFVRVNQRLAEMNGLPVAAHLGRTVRELLPTLADQAEVMLGPVLKMGEPLLNVEISGETPAQPGVQRAWVESFWPLKNGNRVIGISIVCEEVTERLRSEAERRQALADLRQAKADLEQRVAERTAELSAINADLRQRKSVLRSFFNSAAMPMGIVELYDDDILHISDNWAAAERLGTTPEAMANRFASQLGIPPATIARWTAYYREAERTQAPVRFEYLETDYPAPGRWLAGCVCAIAVNPGGPPRFSYMFEDISERKQAEATLGRREEQLRLTLEFTHIGTWDWDLGQDQVIWNDNHFKLLGLDPHQTEDPYQSWRRAIHPDDLDRVEQALQDALHQHHDYETEYRVFYPDGTMRWLVGRGRGIYDSDQQPIRMLGVILDITDRKRAEQIQEFQAVITRNMAEGICVVRADNGMISYANRKFEQMFGYDPGELDGQHVSIVNYATESVSAEDVNQSIRRAVLENLEATYEVHNVKKDGTPFWCSATTSVFEHPEYGSVLVAVQQDISDRKESQEKLQASLKEKELLLKEVYHRVKNNLQVIYSLLNLQSRHVRDSAALGVLRDSQSRVRAMALVHEKLYKSPDLTRIDLADYIHSLASSLLEAYGSGRDQIALRLEIEPYSLDIETALPCGLMLTELISNSLKYAFVDGRPGEIAVASGLGPDQRVWLRVQDNGVGLPKDLQLQRVSSLGLSLVRNLAQQIGGEVAIAPQPVGTAFQITFPG
ncbi:MAG TPA: PAS domain S-box protein [Nodosilinea sp.]|nr:PAS domain S-box protein [Nodosilinea sp.]